MPPTPDGEDARLQLLAAQMAYPPTKSIILQKRAEQGGTRNDRLGLKGHALLKPTELLTYRLDPLDDVLEKKVVLAEGVLWAPVIPDLQMTAGGKTWRKWLFELAHATVLNPHRSSGESFQLLRRMGFWETLGTDFSKWFSQCEVCQRYRSRPVQPPLRSTTADDCMRSKLPWSDVIIDVQGPYTRAEGGERYILSYHCVVLRVPKLEAFRSLQAGYFFGPWCPVSCEPE